MVINMEEFKKDLFDAYEKYCVEIVYENGYTYIDELIDGFMNVIDFRLQYTAGILEDMEKIFNTSDIEEIEKQIEHMIKDYEYND